MIIIIKKSTSVKEVNKMLNNLKPLKTDALFQASKFCGKIKFDENALTIQKRLRNEWKDLRSS